MAGSSYDGGMEDTVIRCPRCAAVVAFGERFCAACGSPVIAQAAASRPAPQGSGTTLNDPVLKAPGTVPQDPVPVSTPLVDLDAKRRLGTARKWLLAISILMAASAPILFALAKSDLEKQITTMSAQAGEMGDAAPMQDGRTFGQAKHHARGMLNLGLAVYLGVAAVFLGLWFWAKRNALAACVVALLLYVTKIVFEAVIDKDTIYQGLIIKIFFIAALASAISAAQRERKLVA